MERLTFRHDCPYNDFHGRAEPCEPINCLDEYSKKALDEVAGRLAAYEDTGLEPEEIKDILERYRGFRTAISDETGQPMVSWTRASELVRADKEGRVVVLPEDGMLYHFEEIPETGERWVGNKPIQKIIFSCGFGLVGIPFDFSQLGKTVFLTRAEAEAAIGGGGDG